MRQKAKNAFECVWQELSETSEAPASPHCCLQTPTVSAAVYKPCKRVTNMWSFSFCVSNCPRQTYISASSYDNTFLPSIWDWSFQTEVHSILEIRHVLIPFLSFDLSIKIHQKSGSFWLLCSGPVSRKCVGDLVKASSSHRSGSIPDICHFFTLTHFESWKFYTQKVRKFTTNLPRDKTTKCRVTHCWV